MGFMAPNFKMFSITAVDISVGQVFGPSTNDSLGHTYLMEPWQVIEWLNLPRDNQLLPGNFEEYDVVKIPDALSRQTKFAIEEIIENFKNKFWHRKGTTEKIFAPNVIKENNFLEENGHILIVTISYNYSTTSYFDHLPEFYQQRVRIISPENWSPEEMIGASAVIFIRMLPFFKEWIEYARKLKIPHYYFLDDNLILKRNELQYEKKLDFFTETNVHNTLVSFSGVLLSTQALMEYFKEKGLHENIYYFPPVFNYTALCENFGLLTKKEKVFRIAFCGRENHSKVFKEIVFPAICEFAKNKIVELFLSGMEENSLQPANNLSIYYFPFEVSHDLMLGRLSSLKIDIIVHPNLWTMTDQYETLSIFLDALNMGAIPILSTGPPYVPFEHEKMAFFCEDNKNSWLKAILYAYDNPEILKQKKENMEAFCQKNYNGESNFKVLREILKKHPFPGPVLRDTRYRGLIYLLRQQTWTSKNKYYNFINPKELKRRVINLSRRLLNK